MKGWLEKHSGGHKGGGLRAAMGNMKSSWERRYFVLADRTLKYYKTEAAVAFGQCLGSFEFRGATLDVREDGTFLLSSQERELSLRVSPAETDAKQRWAAALTATCESHSKKEQRVAGEAKAKRGAAQQAEAEAAQQAGAALACDSAPVWGSPATGAAAADSIGARDGTYCIVDEEDTAKEQVPPEAGEEAEEYWAHVAGHVAGAMAERHPRLVVMFGVPGCGKSRVLQHFLQERGWAKGEFVHLDPDTLRFFSKEYRLCICGAHAARLDSVKARFGGRLRAAEWRSPVGGFVEEGVQVEAAGFPAALTLAFQ